MSIPAGCRRCAKCNVVKPLAQFEPRGSTRRRGICTDCEPEPLRQAMCKSKVRYGTQARALGVAQSAAKRTRFLRVYECPLCAGWHLTHKAEKRNVA